MESERPNSSQESEALLAGDAESLPERLGFYETEELQRLRPVLIEAMASGDTVAIQELGSLLLVGRRDR